MAKKNICLIVSFVLGLIYMIYLVFHFFGSITNTTGAEQVGVGIATAIVMPHMIFVLIGVIFNGVSIFTNNKWLALTGAIGYSISLILFPLYFLFVIVQIILSYIGFAQLLRNVTSIKSVDNYSIDYQTRSKGMDILLNIVIIVSLFIIVFVIYMGFFA
ncbi:MAG: hypothetical protein ACK5L6_13410 [Anaerorhabdus sp.]|uniref:hypothetical protein n=1 Tax=Anaerorhabdus sp. TaxID=1872524 RepID=UPI003A868C60